MERLTDLEKKDQRIAELKKEVEGLNTKLKIWNRFNSEDYMHKGEDLTDRDYYYYTNGASSVLENDLKYYKQENEQLKQQLAEKDKLLENAIVPVLKNFIDKYLNFIEIGVDPLCKCYFCIVHDIAGKEIANKTGYDINKVFFEAIKKTEEALKKLNKE